MLVAQSIVDDQCHENEISSRCGIIGEKREQLAGRLTGAPVKTMGKYMDHTA